MIFLFIFMFIFIFVVTFLHSLDHSHSPEWNSPEVVRAMLSVLTEAVKDSNCKRYV
jgi:Na+-transporting methylmalonyl-CoA/oxaloacetate decarboxylase gamma subunit